MVRQVSPEKFEVGIFCGSLTLPKKEGKSNKQQMYGALEGFFNLIVHCLGCS